MSIDIWLSHLIEHLASKCGCSDFVSEVRVADPRFGDFQENGVLRYAKIRKEAPRKIAEKIFDALQKDAQIVDNFDYTISGPGFINFRFKDRFLCNWINLHHDEISFKRDVSSLAGKTIVLDYSSPNTAKQMHVGHLRSMNIGESICRLLRFCGANVLGDNHIGDWGTQFGIMIMAIKQGKVDLSDIPADQALVEIENLYKHGNALTKENENFLNIAREELVKLQNGDGENLKIWRQINDISYRSFQKIYDVFNIKFDYVLGESFYRDKVEAVYDELTKLGIAREDNGALVVFFENNEKYKDQPFIVRKADGASNYASTDLATIKYRVDYLHADEIIYVTDGRQQDHFCQLFMTANRWFEAINKQLPKLVHVWFGTILGENGKAIKTRDGSPIYLKDLVAEAIKRAYKLVDEKNPNLPREEKNKIAEVVGIGAIRYFDLSQNRTNDYMFSWQNMLSFDGNTAVYMLYAVARLHSILDKAQSTQDHQAKLISTDEERVLMRKLVYFPSILRQTIEDLRPHYLCTYLYELAGEFSAFYSTNRVLGEKDDIKETRLALCERTLLVLKIGLNLLGIETLTKM